MLSKSRFFRQHRPQINSKNNFFMKTNYSKFNHFVSFFLFFTLAFAAQAKPLLELEFGKNLKEAKERAAAEGKIIVVDFVASWCMPCHWMDESTYSDPTIIDFMQRNTIPVKIDIDDFDGYALKDQYNIKVLPTIVFLNSGGSQIRKSEAALTVSELMSQLKELSTKANKRKLIVEKTDPPRETARPNPAPQPKLNSPGATYEAGEGLFRFFVERQALKGFSVQTGAFEDYKQVLNETAKLQEKFAGKAILVHSARVNGKAIFRVMVGEFSTNREASNFSQVMKASNFNGVVKDLSAL